jgi:hypothetical protein
MIDPPPAVIIAGCDVTLPPELLRAQFLTSCNDLRAGAASSFARRGVVARRGKVVTVSGKPGSLDLSRPLNRS